jgi:hypothetical protein
MGLWSGEEVTDMKRLLLLSAVAYGVWTIVKKVREQRLEEQAENTGRPQVPVSP